MENVQYTSKGMPKVINYCWFGRGPKSPLIQKCMETWRKYLPGWQIKEWNEDNFDVNICAYTAEAYAAKKYAFVSDYARFWVLYHHGGVCFCTDVELLRPLDGLLEETPSVMGFEMENTVNPGTIMSGPAGSPMIAEILKEYNGRHFIVDGKPNTNTIVATGTECLQRHGFTGGNRLQQVEEFTIYPMEYFCPFEHETQMMLTTPKTYAMHHFTATWSPWYRKLRFRCIGLAARMLGRERYLALKRKILHR